MQSLLHSSDFYSWFSELETARAQEAAERFERYRQELAAHVAACDAILEDTTQISGACAALLGAHATVAAAGGSLATQCEALEAPRAQHE